MENVDRDTALPQAASGRSGSAFGTWGDPMPDEIRVCLARRDGAAASPPPDRHARENAPRAADVIEIRMRGDEPLERLHPGAGPREHSASALVPLPAIRDRYRPATWLRPESG